MILKIKSTETLKIKVVYKVYDGELELEKMTLNKLITNSYNLWITYVEELASNKS
jgi:hypothetical protein